MRGMIERFWIGYGADWASAAVIIACMCAVLAAVNEHRLSTQAYAERDVLALQVASQEPLESLAERMAESNLRLLDTLAACDAELAAKRKRR